MNICNTCGSPIPPNRYGHTSTLCEDCLEGLREDHAEALDEYRRNRPADDLDLPDPDEGTQGKRDDQVAYSVFTLAALIGFLIVGVSIGVAIATATTPVP